MCVCVFFFFDLFLFQNKKPLSDVVKEDTVSNKQEEILVYKAFECESAVNNKELIFFYYFFCCVFFMCEIYNT